MMSRYRTSIPEYRKRPIRERFMEKVRVADNGCWMWTARTDRHGYGRFHVDQVTRLANRVAYELFVGAIPDGLIVCHSCDNPSCVNPAHLWLGTHLKNAMDKVAKGRQSTTRSGAKLTEDRVREIRELYSQGVRIKDICAMYDIGSGHASMIVHRKLWAELA